MASIFSRIIAGEIPSYKVAEAKKVAGKIKQEIACSRVAVVVLGLEVPHAHIHLIPIKSENDVDFHREKLKLTPEEFEEIATKLSK